MNAKFLAAAFLTFCLLSATAQTNKNQGTATASQAKPDLKQLLAGNSFTNEAGIVMVKISSQLWAGKYLVQQAEYQKVTGSNPSRFSGPSNPVDSVSWNDALLFCAKLNQSEKKAELLPEGFVYSLPTQSQWESLMAGAGLEQAVTSQRARRNGTSPVGSLSANRLGLYDVRGNLWQWCLDPQDKPFRVLRGGAWDTSLEVNLRPEFRWYSTGPDERRDTFGFRVVLEPGTLK